jgi:hypothetical protein
MRTVVDEGAPTPSVLTDGDIQNELSRMLSDGRLPPANKSSVFMVHLPPGITVTRGQRRSCFHFCGYHSSYSNDGVPVRYAVIPDFSPCPDRCGGVGAVDDALAVSSHELLETLTDPDIAQATSIGPPLGWYDPLYGEIGDICNFQLGAVDGFVVQKAWSNRAGACIVSRDDGDEPSDPRDAR